MFHDQPWLFHVVKEPCRYRNNVKKKKNSSLAHLSVIPFIYYNLPTSTWLLLKPFLSLPLAHHSSQSRIFSSKCRFGQTGKLTRPTLTIVSRNPSHAAKRPHCFDTLKSARTLSSLSSAALCFTFEKMADIACGEAASQK